MTAPIGIFDSGIGGLTLARAVREAIPHQPIVYFGDTAHLPYGGKSAAAIQAYAVKICNVLLEQNCKKILIACNSASSAAYSLVKEYVGSKAKVYNVIDPVVDYVADKYAGKCIGVIGTRQTIGSNTYRTQINAHETGAFVKQLATPLLAQMIEEGFFNNNISQHVIREYLSDPALEGIDALILGCTHYPLIKDDIEEFYAGKVEIIDSPSIVAQSMIADESGAVTREKVKDVFYVSDYTKSFESATRIFFGEELDLQLYKLWD